MEYKMSHAIWTGRRHQAENIPCQDRTAAERRGPVCCAALADGAGSRSSSDIGAACVTRYAAGLFCQRFEELWEMEDLAGYLAQGCAGALAREEPPIYELASTLLFGVQILVEDGLLSVFSPPENGTYQNETFFLTGDDAAQHLRTRRGRLEGPGALLMMSDGLAESLYQYASGTPASACRKVAQWLQDGGEEAVSQALERNMEQVFSQRTGDDLSLAVVAWR